MVESSLGAGLDCPSTGSMPPISARGESTGNNAPKSFFRHAGGTSASPRPQPTPPTGPPPSSAVTTPPLALLEALGLRLPNISPREGVVDRDSKKPQDSESVAESPLKQKVDAARKFEAEAEKETRKRIEEISRRATQGDSMMKALTEAQEFVIMREEAERRMKAHQQEVEDLQDKLKQHNEEVPAEEGEQKACNDQVHKEDSQTEAIRIREAEQKKLERERTEAEMRRKGGTKHELQNTIVTAKKQEAEARARVDRRVDMVAPQPEQREKLLQVLVEAERHTRVRLEAEAQLKAEEEATKRAEQATREQEKARRMAEVKLAAESAAAQLAQEEVARAGEKRAAVEALANAEREEIRRAMVAVEEAKRRRVEAEGKRLQAEGAAMDQVRKREHMLKQIESGRNMLQELEREAQRLATRRAALEARRKEETQDLGGEETSGSKVQEWTKEDSEEMGALEEARKDLEQRRITLSKNIENSEKLAELEKEASKLEARKNEVVDKVLRRQNKKEELMKKRKEMEARLKEEASKMTQLTESAKKKGESKLISEEAKREAHELVQAEALAVAELERQAAQMAQQRAEMEKQLAEEENEKAAKIEATSSALRAKREEMEARMRREEEELKSLSESAKRKVEDKMLEEANAIADMERRAAEMASKRAELEAQVSQGKEVDGTLIQQSEQLLQKRKKMEAKMEQEERELQRLSEEAKRRVGEKMASEAAAIAEMECQAAELAKRRTELAEKIATQQALVDQHNADQWAGNVGSYEEVKGESTQCYGNDGIGGKDETDNLASGPNADGTNEAGLERRPLRFANSSRSLYEHMATDSPKEIPQQIIEEVAEDPQQETPKQTTPETEMNPGDGREIELCDECMANQGGLPISHFAAAAGHLSCLQEVQSKSSGLLVLLDSAGRTPLFYSCANGHSAAAKFLIQEAPQCCHIMDANQDTPLHAAALAGSAQCTRLLLQEGVAETEPRNSMQMTPAHLAANNSTLEVLSQHGANLNAKDMDQRTPLFIACATDRLEKAEFLCELLDCAGQDLGEADKRGDTPMHAASCNGSTACLLLLLQYGVQPDVRNKKGLRPIDLAARRGHAACEKILMEYQLHHHVDNSYFDSVLFLATLEGHKKCKKELTDNGQYEIVKPAAKTSPPLERAESLMSLRRGRSVRLKQWGDWIAYEDQNISSVFWYNYVARTSQWEKPAGIDDNQKTGNQQGDADVKNLIANSSMRLKREGEWLQYTLPDGNVFYYNDTTNEFQWERPAELSPLADPEPWNELNSLGNVSEDREDGNGWGAFKDPNTGLVFWYNYKTGESQWEPPGQVVSAVGSQGEALEGVDNAGQTEPQEIVREVDSIDDLFTPR